MARELAQLLKGLTGVAQRNTSVTKVSAAASPVGPMGQRYLASGVSVSMRLWSNEEPGIVKPEVTRDYETVGYVISGRAVLTIADQSITLEPGDSWVVNKGQPHSYRILEPFTAVEATCPPAAIHGRDTEEASDPAYNPSVSLY